MMRCSFPGELCNFARYTNGETDIQLLESRLKDKTLPHGDSQSLGEQGFTNVINLNHATPDIHRRNSILDKNVPTNNGVHAIDGGENAQPLPMNDRTDNDSSGASEPRQIDGGENDVEMMNMKVEKAVEEVILTKFCAILDAELLYISGR